jgi:hypothetical protein
MKGFEKMRSWIAIVVLILFLAAGAACERTEESGPYEPTPAEPLTPKGGAAESRKEALKKKEYREEMKERSLNREDL